MAILLNQHVVVTGARNQIGHFLLPRLLAAGCHVEAISRQPARQQQKEIAWYQLDLQTDLRNSIQNFDSKANSLFHIAPLPLAIPLLQATPTIRRVIAFSSTSRFSKQNSSVSSEQQLAQRLAAGEQQLIDYCQAQGIAWTLFRPTLIYGCGLDKNISFIANFVARFKFFPVAYPAKGLRQPVHADDLAIACLQAWHQLQTYQQAYNLSGGQTLSYVEMVKLVFQKQQRYPFILPIPLSLFQIAHKLSAYIPGLSGLAKKISPAMLQRMNQDLCFDHHQAQQDFDYQPRGFEHAYFD